MTDINEGLFYTLAQVTIALAGFSAVAIGLVAQRNRELSVFERANAWCIFAFAVLTFLASIIPVVLLAAGASLDIALLLGLVPSAMGGIPISYLAIKVTHNLLQSEEERTRIVGKFTGRVIAYGARFWAIAVMAVIWLTMLDFLIPRTEAVYVGTILLGIVLSLTHFAFFIGLSLQSSSDSKTEAL